MKRIKEVVEIFVVSESNDSQFLIPERMLIDGLVSIVLARGGASGGARKTITALEVRVGGGSAWTRTNLELEEIWCKSKCGNW